MPIVCACEHPNQMYLQLRGLCPDSNLDRFYVPRNQEGAVILIGLKTSLISYDKVAMIAMCNEGKQMKQERNHHFGFSYEYKQDNKQKVVFKKSSNL